MAATATASAGAAAAAAAGPARFENPYAGHRLLPPREQEVLGEYARLAATIKRIETLSSSLAASERHTTMLRDLRVLERKMGLVLTLFKASVWSLIQTHQDELEQQQQQDEGTGAYSRGCDGEGAYGAMRDAYGGYDGGEYEGNGNEDNTAYAGRGTYPVQARASQARFSHTNAGWSPP